MQAIDSGLLSAEIWEEEEEDEQEKSENESDPTASEVFFGPDCSRKVNIQYTYL